ncbi:MAG TPA: thymidylate synthase [bacterium]|nr:thymidylate synthase [bacterium]
MLQTYLPKKYQVYFGQGVNIGLATCWSDPKLLMEKTANHLMDKIAIVGSLYSMEGVSIIIRNLALNPQINQLIVWTNSPLSDTAIGKSGLQLLKQLFINGINDDHSIVGTTYRLHTEIDINVIKKIIHHVQIIDFEGKSIDDLSSHVFLLHSKNSQPYMLPINFPETQRDTSMPQPSENVGWLVRDQKLINVWLKLVDKILRYGSIKLSDYGNRQKELQYATWVINDDTFGSIFIPDWPAEVLSTCGFTRQKIDDYKNMLLTPELPAETTYTYGYRLRNYLGQVDQIAEIVRLLKESVVTRRAYATTFIPPEDLFQNSPPCLTSIQVITDINQKLNMFVYFRSHDIFKAALTNAAGLLNLQQYIAEQSGYLPGQLTISSASAHIYEEEWDMAAKLIDCQYLHQISTSFNAEKDSDPRGLVRIMLENNQIHFELVDQQGNILNQFNAVSAKEIAYKISHLDLLSRPDHYCDISMELLKAEYCLVKKIPYAQDRNLW